MILWASYLMYAFMVLLLWSLNCISSSSITTTMDNIRTILLCTSTPNFDSLFSLLFRLDNFQVFIYLNLLQISVLLIQLIHYYILKFLSIFQLLLRSILFICKLRYITLHLLKQFALNLIASLFNLFLLRILPLLSLKCLTNNLWGSFRFVFCYAHPL